MGEGLAVGIDFGGTKMLGVLCNEQAEVLVEHRVATPYNPEELLDSVIEVTEALETSAPAGISALGVGAAGLVNRRGVLNFGPNVGGVTGVDVMAGLQNRRPDLSIAVDNDATCATWSEGVLGAGKGHASMVLVTLGTGIGGGIILDGRIAGGSNGFSGEFGHMAVEVGGVTCVCGKDGCWESYASGRALGRLGREAAQRGNARRILELAGAVDDIRGEHVTVAAREGNQQALEIEDEFARWVAAGIANVIAIVDPEVVVIGGGLAEDADLFLPATRRHLTTVLFGAESRPEVPVVAARLGEYAGATGAALIAFERL